MNINRKPGFPSPSCACKTLSRSISLQCEANPAGSLGRTLLSPDFPDNVQFVPVHPARYLSLVGISMCHNSRCLRQ